ncbi:MAG: hypothetical protein HON47_01995 [Candidatus Diapherotrites archaeon]|jgi:hypothetical protein|uniref:Uncharacterized protein n=1 Tax=Candidatus Iainarchaeum sp. TaxID=3101447 RepID=A0A8T5GEZ3_9ARCH|nr:hypothetical protein [Candidatus Diapherotrites archaeon]MBT7241494.1 hypothetical protein [Candidatus Diapherotrites archaeon]
MEQETILKIGGIVIVAVMAFSMIAAALIYVPDSTSDNTDGINTNPIVNTFKYDLEFESSTIKELNSFRMLAKTSHLNKQEIDLVVRGLSEVSSVSSEFRKNEGNNWDYFAEISLKKNALVDDVVDKIYELKYFEGAEKVAMKYMTISSPGELMLYNSELDIDRNFVFEAPTLPVLVSTETLPGDLVSVAGTITLRGKDITALELVESSNTTAQPQYFSVTNTLPIISLGNELLFEGQTSDTNIDQNYYQDEIAKIDESIQLFFVPDENTIRFAGQSKVENSDAILNLFSSIESLSFFQDAEFELSNVFVSELDKEIQLDSNTLSAQVRLGHALDEEVNLSINLVIARDVASVMQAIEN